jgi:hypothetical protein
MKKKKEKEKYIDALIWMSGSDDFQYPNGKARKGWEKIVKPLVKVREIKSNLKR